MRFLTFVLLLVISACIFSFKEKSPLLVPHYFAKTDGIIKKPAFYTSEWESVAEWSLTDGPDSKNYYFNRSTPELTQSELDEGAVMVFAKGYDLEGFSKAPEKVLTLPFYFMSTNEILPHAYNWSSDNSAGNIKISLNMHGQLENAFHSGREKIKLRYIVLSKDFLDKNKLTQQTVRSKNYKQMIEVMGIGE